MSIQQLPVELCHAIAAYIDDPVDRQCLRITCKAFHSIIPGPDAEYRERRRNLKPSEERHFYNDAERWIQFRRRSFLRCLFEVPGDLFHGMESACAICHECKYVRKTACFPPIRFFYLEDDEYEQVSICVDCIRRPSTTLWKVTPFLDTILSGMVQGDEDHVHETFYSCYNCEEYFPEIDIGECPCHWEHDGMICVLCHLERCDSFVCSGFSDDQIRENLDHFLLARPSNQNRWLDETGQFRGPVIFE